MPSPGFDDPRLASLPPAGNLYFGASRGLSEGLPGTLYQNPASVPGHAENRSAGDNVRGLMFGGGMATTGSGAAIVHAANQTSGSGHWKEIFNFHGSPAPWILLGILLVAGLLHLSAGAKAGVRI